MKNDKKTVSNIDFLGIETNTLNQIPIKKEFKFIKKEDKNVDKIDVVNAFSVGSKDDSKTQCKSSFKFIKQSNQSDTTKSLTSFDDLIENVSIITPSKRTENQDIGLIDLTKGE